MDTKWRFGATIVIWAFATLLSIIIIGNMSLGGIADWVIAIPLGVALVATLAIWESGKDSSSKQESKSASLTQTDNTAYSMALLMEMMDDDEREEFKHNLKQRILSGENVTNESLILDMEKRKRG
ncbi:MAG: hypothetical protein SH821_03330 [Phototrophicales bacterium]|nr:hypothetical protein [Phototrophicales bacterium]